MPTIDEFRNKIICGNTLDVLRQIPSDSIDCIITSPPYWGLRWYGEQTKTIWDGDPKCEHEFSIQTKATFGNNSMIRGKDETDPGNFAIPKFGGSEMKQETKVVGAFCKKCGAWYGQLGLEPDLNMYHNHLLQITAELKRILKKTGTMWWVHGDSYCGSQGHFDAKNPKAREGKLIPDWKDYPKKCLYLQNYRLAIRMIDEQGWTLRNSVCWVKPNHMPSSVTDRLSNAYEPVFFFTKSQRYFFDLDSIRVPPKTHENRPYGIVRTREWNYNSSYPQVWKLEDPSKPKKERNRKPTNPQSNNDMSMHWGEHPLGKNPGNVWTINTQPGPLEARGKHFAIFPPKLVEPMILSGCPREVCKKCGKPRERIIESEHVGSSVNRGGHIVGSGDGAGGGVYNIPHQYAKKEFVGWSIPCNCDAGFQPGIVLDPFAGSGTTCVVAKKLGYDYIGIEINPEYCEIARKRLEKTPRTLALDRFTED
jgi:DNA modification methylase